MNSDAFALHDKSSLHSMQNRQPNTSSSSGGFGNARALFEKNARPADSAAANSLRRTLASRRENSFSQNSAGYLCSEQGEYMAQRREASYRGGGGHQSGSGVKDNKKITDSPETPSRRRATFTVIDPSSPLGRLTGSGGGGGRDGDDKDDDDSLGELIESPRKSWVRSSFSAAPSGSPTKATKAPGYSTHSGLSIASPGKKIRSASFRQAPDLNYSYSGSFLAPPMTPGGFAGDTMNGSSAHSAASNNNNNNDSGGNFDDDFEADDAASPDNIRKKYNLRNVADSPIKRKGGGSPRAANGLSNAKIREYRDNLKEVKESPAKGKKKKNKHNSGRLNGSYRDGLRAVPDLSNREDDDDDDGSIGPEDLVETLSASQRSLRSNHGSSKSLKHQSSSKSLKKQTSGKSLKKQSSKKSLSQSLSSLHQSQESLNQSQKSFSRSARGLRVEPEKEEEEELLDPKALKKQRKRAKKQNKAARKIQAVVRGGLVRRRREIFVMQKRVRDLELRLLKIEKEKQAYLQKMRDQVDRQHDEVQVWAARERKTLSRQQDSASSSKVEESQQLIAYLRKENQKMRAKNEQLYENCKNLKVNNRRLTSTNESSSSYYDQLKSHHRRCLDDFKKLEKVSATYKAKVEQMEDSVNRRILYGNVEHKQRMSYAKMVDYVIDLVETAGQMELAADLRYQAQELEEFSMLSSRYEDDAVKIKQAETTKPSSSASTAVSHRERDKTPLRTNLSPKNKRNKLSSDSSDVSTSTSESSAQARRNRLQKAGGSSSTKAPTAAGASLGYFDSPDEDSGEDDISLGDYSKPNRQKQLENSFNKLKTPPSPKKVASRISFDHDDDDGSSDDDDDESATEASSVAVPPPPIRSGSKKATTTPRRSVVSSDDDSSSEEDSDSDGETTESSAAPNRRTSERRAGRRHAAASEDEEESSDEDSSSSNGGATTESSAPRRRPTSRAAANFSSDDEESSSVMTETSDGETTESSAPRRNNGDRPQRRARRRPVVAGSDDDDDSTTSESSAAQQQRRRKSTAKQQNLGASAAAKSKLNASKSRMATPYSSSYSSSDSSSDDDSSSSSSEDYNRTGRRGKR